MSVIDRRRMMMTQKGRSYFDYMEFPYSRCGCFLTDIIPSYATEIEVCLKHRTPHNSDFIFCGCENTLWDYRIAVWVWAGSFCAAKSSTAGYYNITSDDDVFDKKVIIKIGNNQANYGLEGGQTGYIKYNTPNPFDNRVVFAIGGYTRENDVFGGGFIGDFYYLKVWENNNLVADFRAHADNEFVNILNGDIIRNSIQGGQTYARND